MTHLENPLSLYHALQNHAGRDFVCFHMPGHKGQSFFAPQLPWHLDITEISGFDNLHAPEGILEKSQKLASNLWGARESFLLVNGSTAGILAGIYATVNVGDKILVARNCHKAVYHAMELLQLKPIFIDPPQIKNTGILGSISPKQVADALKKHPDIGLCILVSPTYEGIISDISAISHLLGSIPLLVDQAHGAHLGLGPHFPQSAITQGASLVVQSLHKTLPSLTQTALLHVASEHISPKRVQHALGIFQSSSPSYPLMASIDACLVFLQKEGKKQLATWHENLLSFYEDVKNLQHLQMFSPKQYPEDIFHFDPSKLTLLCQNTSINAYQLEAMLRDNHHILLEMALSTHALAMTGMGNNKADYTALSKALKELDNSLSATIKAPKPIPLPPLGTQHLSIYQALHGKEKTLPFAQCKGEISAAYVWVTPPCVPILVPGTEITADILAYLQEINPQHIRCSKDSSPGFIACVDK